MGHEYHYVYGVTEAGGEPFTVDVEGVNGAESVYTVEYRNLAAIVTDVDTREPPQTDENVTAHDAVLTAVMLDGDGRAVVPMQFGMVFDSERTIKNVLRNARPAFRAALHEVDGAVELGVKVVNDEDGTVDAAAIREAAENELEPLSTSVSAGDKFSDRLVLNRSYLVPHAKRTAFDDAIDSLKSVDENATVQYTGPWAPYNFVDIEIGVKQ